MSVETTVAPLQPAPKASLREKGFHTVRIAVGLLLVTAAALKTYGLTFGPIAVDAFLLSPQVQIAAVEVEAILGILLLMNAAIRYTWLAATALFVLLAGVSL